jgi:hypothetical protein
MIFGKCKTLLGYAFCAGLPALASIAAVSSLLNSSLDAYWPVVSDDVSINHQIRTFASAGFSGGYYTIDEIPAFASFSHFGPHGPFYPALYGSLLRLFEPSVFGPIWLNHVMTFAACICSFLIARVSVARAFSVSIVTATFWPVVCMQAVSMQETLHFSVSVLGAGLVFRTNFPKRVMAWGLYCAMSIVRPTWALATITTFRRPANISGLATQILIVVAFSVLAFLPFLSASAPTPSGISNQALAVLGGGGLETKATNIASYFLVRAWTNIAFVFRPSQWQPLEGEVFITSGFVVLFALAFRSRRMQASCFALILAFLAVLILYDAGNYRGFRVLAPFTLLALTSGALSENRLFAPLVVSLNLLFTPTFVQFYSESRAQMFDGRVAEFNALAKKISDHLKFDPSLDPWCNTVLIDHTEIGPAAAAIPAGFGLSVTAGLGSSLTKPKSAFLWVSNENRAPMTKQAGAYEPILEIGDTVILLNKDSACLNGDEDPSKR